MLLLLGFGVVNSRVIGLKDDGNSHTNLTFSEGRLMIMVSILISLNRYNVALRSKYVQ